MNEHHHDPQEDHLLEHSYDGIQEYDNPLPRWWVVLFWITIVITPLYILYYHFGPGPLAHDRYDAAMVAFYDKQAEELLAMGEITEATLVGLTGDQSMMNSGEKIFQGKCATCHKGGTLPFVHEIEGEILDKAYLNYKLILHDRSFGIHNPGYIERLLDDSIAALIVTIMLIPQSLAYALLAGLPPEGRKFKPHITLARFNGQALAALTLFSQRILTRNG